MNASVTTVPVYRVDPQRLAWGVLLVAFAIFCLLGVIIIIGVDYFLFQSSVPIQGVLTVGRGSVGIADVANPLERAERRGATISQGMIITTDLQSQGMIQIADDDSIIALVTVENNSAVTMRTATRPRYEWSRVGHVISLGNFFGRLSVDIPADAGSNILFDIESIQGTAARLEGSGQYIINATDAEFTVFNREGRVILIPADRRVGHLIPPDNLGTVDYETGEFSQQLGLVDLLADSGPGSVNTSNQWLCDNDPDDNPLGEYELRILDGLPVVRFIRANGATSHGRTSCVQSFGQTGLSVRPDEFNYLAIRTTFFIEYQSLNVCNAIDGSECPLMLRMDYIDADGEAQKWFHGFYAREADTQSNVPLRCASCQQDHERINERAWYIYESPNLFSLLEPAPASIVGIMFYASGHQWDVRVSDLAIMGAYLESAEADDAEID